MKLSFTHDGIPAAIIQEQRDDDQPEVRPFLHLDLGYPDMGLDASAGPRISVRRTNNNEGWRIVIHPDGGDPAIAHDITDATQKEAPVIITDHNP